MNQKTTIELWLSRDLQNPVLKKIRMRVDADIVGSRDFSDSGGRESLRGYCICLILAKTMWTAGFSKDSLEGQVIIETRRSGREVRNINFVNNVASLYLSRGRDKGRPPWFRDFLKVVSDPIKAKYRDKKRDFVRIVFRQTWADYEWEFFTVGASLKDPEPINDPKKFAQALEKACTKWAPVLTDDYVVIKLKLDFKRPNAAAEQGGRSIPAQPGSLVPLKESFDSYLAKAKQALENGKWSKSFVDSSHPEHKFAQIGARIGDSQRQKTTDEGARRATPIPGDWHYLLESTHATLLSINRAFPEIGKAFDSLTDALEVIDQIETRSKQLKTDFSRNSWIRELGDVFPPQRIYLFLLFFTFLCIEAPNAQRVQRSKRLFRKNVLFTLLNGHPAGINDCFFQFHGQKMFCRPGEIFRNRYYQEYRVKNADTLQTVIQQTYIDGNIDFAACVRGIVEAHPFLANVDPKAQLLPILKRFERASVTIVPPVNQNSTFQKEVDQVTSWREERNR